MQHLFCHYMFLTSPSFSSLGRLCFVIVALPEYIHLYFYMSVELMGFIRE